jgi:hypothetical protein
MGSIDILKNSYVVGILSFISLYITFYLLGIGYETEKVNGRVIKKMSYRYPLILALIIWLAWHFMIYPHPSVEGKKSVQVSPLGGHFDDTKSLSSVRPIVNTEMWF